jgi:hypothetical protein
MASVPNKISEQKNDKYIDVVCEVSDSICYTFLF